VTSLKGRVAVVTGAAQGIGRAIAERLLAQGAQVLCADKNSSVHAVSAGHADSAASMLVDVSKEADIISMIEAACKRWGRLDVLCNNAGTDGHSAVLPHCSAADFDFLMSVNLRSTFLGMKYAIPHMVEGGGGSIINISSVAGLVGFETQSIYSASKSGIIGMTRAAALEYGPARVRVNAVCPGGVLTPLTEKFLAEAGDSLEKWMQKVPLRRFAEASEIASVVAFLAGDDASFITGAAIAVDGGFTAA
jgi:meso-butanediol dehydrogenase / (S,S)-butanediol dehydrogenase / diacetyl reductase